MVKATASFLVEDPSTGRVLEFRSGDTVPDHVAALVGEHVLDGPPPVVAGLVESVADDAGVDELRALFETFRVEFERLGGLVRDQGERIVVLEAGGPDVEESDGADVDAAVVEGDPVGDLDDLDGAADAPPAADLFDPSQHDMKGVLAYLETADSEESDRVRDAERAGKARKGILGDDG